MNVTVKCRCLYDPDDPIMLRETQERELLRLTASCRAQRRELLLEIVVGGNGQLKSEDVVARALSRLYELRVRPDWWQLQPQSSPAAWSECAKVIATQDPFCRGVLVLALAGSLSDVSGSLQLAAAYPIVRGFVVAGTIAVRSAEAWLSGRISDETATEEMAGRFRALVELWRSARDPRLDEAEGSLA